MNKGITYMETIIAAGLLAVIGGVLIAFINFMGAWAAQEEARFQIQLALDRSVECIVRDLRKINGESEKEKLKVSNNNDEIRFRDPNDTLYLIYYFDEVGDSYHLKKTELDDPNDINSSFDADSGDYIAGNIVPPDQSDPDNTSKFELDSNNFVSIRLVIQKDDDKITINTKARPRNL